jgi:TRAP-type C4-dicarboxylate transport system permease small subunit
VPTVAPADRLLGRLNRLAARIEDGLLVGLLGAMIILAGWQIFLRNALDAGLGWGDPLLRVMVLWLGILGALAATRDDNHITIDVLSRFLPARSKNLAHAVTDLFSAAVCAVIAYHAGRFVVMEFEDSTVAFAAVPTWVCESIIPLGFGVMAVRFAAMFLERLQPPPRAGP